MLQEFIETVVKNKEVFYLEVDESFAMCGSQAFYIEETKEAIPVALFWEDEEKAVACKADEWAKGIVKSATLEEFIEICFGMQVETMAVGIGFNADLSGGEKQRLVLARVLIRNYPILILDEATSALDEKTAVQIENNILADNKLTLIMISHHIQEEIKKQLTECVELKVQ